MLPAARKNARAHEAQTNGLASCVSRYVVSDDGRRKGGRCDCPLGDHIIAGGVLTWPFQKLNQQGHIKCRRRRASAAKAATAPCAVTWHLFAGSIFGQVQTASRHLHLRHCHNCWRGVFCKRSHGSPTWRYAPNNYTESEDYRSNLPCKPSKHGPYARPRSGAYQGCESQGGPVRQPYYVTIP